MCDVVALLLCTLLYPQHQGDERGSASDSLSAVQLSGGGGRLRCCAWVHVMRAALFGAACLSVSTAGLASSRHGPVAGQALRQCAALTPLVSC